MARCDPTKTAALAMLQCVQQDVAVVPVLDLQQVARHRPGGHAAAEVERGAAVVARGGWAVQQHEELRERGAPGKGV